MVLEHIGVERELLHPASFSRSTSTAKLSRIAPCFNPPVGFPWSKANR
jgi:hypothetical protein